MSIKNEDFFEIKLSGDMEEIPFHENKSSWFKRIKKGINTQQKIKKIRQVACGENVQVANTLVL